MGHYLLPSTPLHGHVAPMLTIGRGLAARGHRVDVLTGRAFRHRVRAAGLGFRLLPTDDQAAELRPADRVGRGRIGAGRDEILDHFLRPIPAQAEAVEQALSAEAYDAIVADTAFLGLLPLLLGRPAGRRLPAVGVSVTPLSLHSVDCAHFGSGLAPGSSPFSRMRNRQIRWLLGHGPLRPVQDALDAALAPWGIPGGTIDFFDHVAAFDVAFHLGVAGIEYPRRELPGHIRLVGPLPAVTDLETGPVPEPDWWGDLDAPRPIVHVTQGTVANLDLSQLLIPTIRALAGEDVLVVAATGGRPVAEVTDALGGLPANARVAEFLPYALLLPRAAALVTNGGYGTVLQALGHGVPMLVAGGSEDKPEVAARVAWSGAGINLRTGRPSPRQLRTGVRRVLADPRYRQRAGALRQEIAAGPDPVELIADALVHLEIMGGVLLGLPSTNPSRIPQY